MKRRHGLSDERLEEQNMLSAIGSLYVIRTDRTGDSGLLRSTEVANRLGMQLAPIAVHHTTAEASRRQALLIR
jgi:hypothetical protein